MGIRNLLAVNPQKRRNEAFWKRIATPVCGLARNDRLFRQSQPPGGRLFAYRLWMMVSGGRMTTRALSATDSVRKALPPTTAFSPMTVSPPKMDAPE